MRALFSTCSSQSLLPRVATISGWKAKWFPWVAFYEFGQLHFFLPKKRWESHLFRFRSLQDDHLSFDKNASRIAEAIISIPCICKSHILHVRTNSVYTYFVYIYIYMLHITELNSIFSFFLPVLPPSFNMTFCEVPVVHCRSMTCAALKVFDRWDFLAEGLHPWKLKWDLNMSNEKKPVCLGYKGDGILPSYVGI